MDNQVEEEHSQVVVSKDGDFNAWLFDQANMLRNRRYAIDWDGLAEELEATARKT